MKFTALGTLSALVFAAFGATLALAEPLHSGLMASQGPDRYLARDNLVGVKVHDSENTIVGDVEDIIIDSTNRVVGVIIGTGGILGVGEKRVGVRLNALDFAEADGTTHAVLVGVSKADLEAAPAFERAKAKKSLLQRAKEKAQELTDKTTATSQKAYEKVKPTVDAATETVKETYEKAKDAATDAITPSE